MNGNMLNGITLRVTMARRQNYVLRGMDSSAMGGGGGEHGEDRQSAPETWANIGKQKFSVSFDGRLSARLVLPPISFYLKRRQAYFVGFSASGRSFGMGGGGGGGGGSGGGASSALAARREGIGRAEEGRDVVSYDDADEY